MLFKGAEHKFKGAEYKFKGAEHEFKVRNYKKLFRGRNICWAEEKLL